MWFGATGDEESDRKMEITNCLTNQSEDIALNGLVGAFIETVNGNKSWVWLESEAVLEAPEDREVFEGLHKKLPHLSLSRFLKKMGIFANNPVNVSSGLRKC